MLQSRSLMSAGGWGVMDLMWKVRSSVHSLSAGPWHLWGKSEMSGGHAELLALLFTCYLHGSTKASEQELGEVPCRVLSLGTCHLAFKIKNEHNDWAGQNTCVAGVPGISPPYFHFWQCYHGILSGQLANLSLESHGCPMCWQVTELESSFKIAFPETGGMKSQEFPPVTVYLITSFFFFNAGLSESLLPYSGGLSKEHIKDVDTSLIS